MFFRVNSPFIIAAAMSVLWSVAPPSLLAQGHSENATPEQVADQLGERPDIETVRKLGPAVTSLLADDLTAFDALPVAEQAINSLRLADPATERDDALLEQLLQLSARVYFVDGDRQRAVPHLNTLERLYREQTAELPDDESSRELSRRLAVIATEFLNGGRHQEARSRITEISSILPAFDHDDFDGALATLAATWHRELVRLDAEERFQLLHEFTMPDGTTGPLHVLESLTPVEGPPPAFARVRGERPRDDAFPIPQIGPADGMFSSAWMLVEAAVETGRLEQLINELQPLAEQNRPHAWHTLLLAQVASPDTDSASLGAEIERNASERTTLADVVVAAACASQLRLTAVADELLDRLTHDVVKTHSPRLAPVVHRLRALILIDRSQPASPDVLSDPNLKLWVPASASDGTRDAAGALRESWLVSDEHVLHLCGPHRDYLCFRYPLTGDFEFTCDTQAGQASQGAVAYGGLATEVYGGEGFSKVWNVDTARHLERPFQFVRLADWKTFQRWRVTVSGDELQFVCNGHPVWTGTLAGTSSPWLALRSFGSRLPAFRNLEITGTPQIPREVRMSEGNVLAGWLSTYYPSAISPRLHAIAQPDIDDSEEEYDWSIQDGVITGRRTPMDTQGFAPARLSYFRPLLPGESIDYEFEWKPGESVVHPAIDRLAFVLEPSGVRLRWLTTGDDDASGLWPGSSIAEPAHRRGPRRLPLKAGEWNAVTIMRTSDTVQISLNDVPIYERPIDSSQIGRFSLTHDRKRSTARARNVVLRGDWPETFDLSSSLLAAREDQQAKANAQVIGAIFNDRHVPDSAIDMHRRAQKLAWEDRFDVLSDWVLPSRTHDTFRLALDLTPTNPAPPARLEQPAFYAHRARIIGGTRIPSGGRLVSPALDLVRAARELGRLDELRSRVSSSNPSNEVQQRCRLAMLIVIDLAAGNHDAAIKGLDELDIRLEAQLFDGLSDRWPETLALHAATMHPETDEATQDILTRMLNDQCRGGRSNGPQPWDRLIEQMYGRLMHRTLLRREGKDEQSIDKPPRLQNWSPVTRSIAWSRGQGIPTAHWHSDGTQVRQLASHDQDFLYYRLPLRGNFELECDVRSFNWNDTAMLVAGEWVAPVHDHESYAIGGFRELEKKIPVEPRLAEADVWIRYRAVVRDGKCTTYFNGRRMHERTLPENHDPWIAARALPYRFSGIRDVRITGSPVIPRTISLSSLPDLPGWLPYYTEPSVGEGKHWRHLDDSIVGRLEPADSGQAVERLLRYHRPMLEDGIIEYDFYYEQGIAHAHPALDRKVFMLTSDGVQIHWATDGVHETSELDARNLYVEPDSQLNTGPLPLKEKAWNTLRLSLRGNTVTLQLNGQGIYRGDLEETNLRTFALFHYAGRNRLQVRNINWTGTWPLELPPVEKQELFLPTIDSVLAKLQPLRDRFEHDFTKQGLPTELFHVYDNNAEPTVTVDEDGVHVSRPGKQGYEQTLIAPKMWIHGDFDLEASFSGCEISPTSSGAGGISLRAIVEDPLRTHYGILRGRMLFPDSKPRNYVESQQILMRKDGPDMQFPGNTAEESTSGRMRVIRCGNTISTFFSESDSPHFRLIHTQTELPRDRSLYDGVQLLANIHSNISGDSYVRVVWKSISVQAESITGLPEQASPDR